MRFKFYNSILISIIIVLASLIGSWADGQKSTIGIGDQVPKFQANDENGNLWKLQDHLGEKQLVIYFYPAAMTGGCTKQACSYRDHRDDLTAMDIEVVGISGDPVKNLKIFKDTNGLNFTLLSDVSGEIASKFGVPIKPGKSIKRTIEGKEMSLERAHTIARWTFIVDKEGKVVYKNTDVKAQNDSQEVIKFLKSIK